MSDQLSYEKVGELLLRSGPIGEAGRKGVWDLARPLGGSGVVRLLFWHCIFFSSGFGMAMSTAHGEGHENIEDPRGECCGGSRESAALSSSAGLEGQQPLPNSVACAMHVAVRGATCQVRNPNGYVATAARRRAPGIP